jgi:hypothetical protein
MSCVASCSGFSVLRDECVQNACLANNLCTLVEPGFSGTCSEWCCQKRGGYVFFMVFFMCGGTFLLLVAYYLKRLFDLNVQAGAIDANGNVPQPEAAKKGAGKQRGRSISAASL